MLLTVSRPSAVQHGHAVNTAKKRAQALPIQNTTLPNPVKVTGETRSKEPDNAQSSPEITVDLYGSNNKGMQIANNVGSYRAPSLGDGGSLEDETVPADLDQLVKVAESLGAS